MSNDNRNEGDANNVVQSSRHDGDVNAPVITGDGATIIQGDNHGSIHQTFGGK
ncbi:hypothetical protein [Saccharopolyspora taberi]|uniref:Uncharacterized protein n=1 Tax=Saccharopolyspora taberi TaxID=60895 RepID=A0ABN3V0J5_9PSEU